MCLDPEKKRLTMNPVTNGITVPTNKNKTKERVIKNQRHLKILAFLTLKGLAQKNWMGHLCAPFVDNFD